MTLKTLDGLTEGKYLITTESGTQHFVDLDERFVIRNGVSGREWGDQFLWIDIDSVLSGDSPKFAAHYEPVTPDGEKFHFDLIQNATVGKRMSLDNSTEWRVTSEVQSIERVDKGEK